MISRFLSSLAVFLIAAAMVHTAEASLIYSIDIDSTVGDGGPIATQAGWTSLDASSPPSSNGASVTVDGISFSIGSAQGSRIRRDGGGIPEPNDLTADFVFDEAGGNAAVIMFFGGAGDLIPGTWQVEVWSHDSDVSAGQQIVGYRTNTSETIVSTSIFPDPSNPAATFTFVSDGTSAYDVFLRENNGGNRTRLNAVRLTFIVPEPSTGLILCSLMAGTFLRRRRRRV